MAKRQTRMVYSASCETQAWIEKTKHALGVPGSRVIAFAVKDFARRMGLAITLEEIEAIRERNKASSPEKAHSPELTRAGKIDRALEGLRKKGFLL